MRVAPLPTEPLASVLLLLAGRSYWREFRRYLAGEGGRISAAVGLGPLSDLGGALRRLLRHGGFPEQNHGMDRSRSWLSYLERDAWALTFSLLKPGTAAPGERWRVGLIVAATFVSAQVAQLTRRG